jgi:hypothetical protein
MCCCAERYVRHCYTVHSYTEGRYAECHYAVCRYPECHGASQTFLESFPRLGTEPGIILAIFIYLLQLSYSSSPDTSQTYIIPPFHKKLIILKFPSKVLIDFNKILFFLLHKPFLQKHYCVWCPATVSVS